MNLYWKEDFVNNVDNLHRSEAMARISLCYIHAQYIEILCQQSQWKSNKNKHINMKKKKKKTKKIFN